MSAGVSADLSDAGWYLSISVAYRKSFRVLWKNAFESKPRSEWDDWVLVGPLAFLIGHSLEMVLKGLILCIPGRSAPKTHDLEKLLTEFNKTELPPILDGVLENITAPKWFQVANPNSTDQEAAAMFSRHHVHFFLINKLYNRPFPSRYPTSDGVVPFEPAALDAIAGSLQCLLSEKIAYPKVTI
jgi:hypothetical protein